MVKNIRLGIIGSKELAEIQDKIDTMPPKEYRLKDIVGDANWATTRKQRGED